MVLEPVLVGGIVRTMLPQTNELRAKLGLKPLEGIRDLFTRMPLLLYLTAEPFEYPRSDWPPNIRMVGPCPWDPPVEVPGWLDEITDPIILVTTSSEFQDDGKLVTTALAALADQPVHVVATLPAAEIDQTRVPSNAHVGRFVPHAAVLERAACAVTHGGMGATQKALANGVPVCAVPFGRDQMEVARRVEISGAGTRLPATRLNTERLRAAVNQARDCQAGSARIARAFEAAGGAGAAASAIEDLVANSAPDPAPDRIVDA